MSTSWLYELCGVWVVLVHVGAGMFALAVALVYTTVWVIPLLSYSITQVESDILDYFGATIGICYAILAGHVLLVLRILLETSAGRAAIRRWRLRRATVAPSARLLLITPGNAEARVESSMSSLAVFSSWSIHRTRLDQQRSQLSLWWASHTPEITRLRMVSEVSFQIYQANKTSQLVASVAINRLMAMVIVLNCWFSPAVHYMMRGRPSLAIRLVRLVLDACLDIVYSIMIPTSIFLPYYHAYLGEPMPFANINYYMDTWYTNALSEMRQVFVTSWIDLVSKTIASLALLYRLYVVQCALTTAREVLARPRQSRKSTLPEIRRRPMSWLCRILDIVLLVAGLAVLALHVQSSGMLIERRRDRGCLLAMNPWGATSYTCACLEISCSQHDVLGERLHLQAILESVDPHSVQVLILSNCPELHVPQAIQRLANVMMIKLYISTIVSWDHDAALRQRFHPSLQVLYFARVNSSSIPMGLLQHDFPPSVWDIEFCITNFTTALPDAIAQAWRSAVYVLLEGNPDVAEIPSLLLQMPSVDSLLVSSNGIRFVPDHALASRSFVQLSFDHNPLQELPESIGSFERLYVLGVRGTNVSSLPAAWLAASGAQIPDHPVTILASNTPLCTDVLANRAGTHKDGLALFQLDWFRVDCFSLAAPRDQYVYPIVDEDHWRRENQ